MKIMQSKEFVDHKVNVKVILAALWIAAMFIYIYADIKTFFEPGFLELVKVGKIGPITVTQGFLLGAALLMSIPPIMIILSLILKAKANRIVNIIVSAIHILLIIVLQFFPGEKWAFYIYYNIIEGIFHILIIWFALRWPKN